jgi:hypothetical protein
LIGPGLLVAAAGIGAGDIVSSTMAGSAHGPRLLWVVALAANNFKIPAASGVPKNSTLTNVVLLFALALFAIVGASEAGLLR